MWRRPGRPRPPHAIFIDRGAGSHIWDLDGNEYVDYHLGYGAMVVGHAHPKVVEAIEKRARLGTHFAQPTAQLHEIGENVSERFGLPLWRFCNSGTEATLEAVRLMRANTGRDLIVKIEGSYHGHHDSLMFSVAPDPELIGAREHPVTVPQAMGIPQAFADLVRVVPFNDLAEAERAFAENDGRIAGMIVEPAMMNCGVVLPQPGYLEGLLDLCHRNGAYLAFDEVKTGGTIAWGGAVEAFGVQPDIVTLAKAFGGGVPCGAIGATEELFGPVLRGEHDIAGTFNGNPLTMAAAKATLARGPDAGCLRSSARDRPGAEGRAPADHRPVSAPRVCDRDRCEGIGHLLRDGGARVPRHDRDRRTRHVPRVADAAEPRGVQVPVGQAWRPGRSRSCIPTRTSSATSTTSRRSPPPSRAETIAELA